MSGLNRRIDTMARHIRNTVSKRHAPKDSPSKAELREQLAQAVRNTKATAEGKRS